MSDGNCEKQDKNLQSIHAGEEINVVELENVVGSASEMVTEIKKNFQPQNGIVI